MNNVSILTPSVNRESFGTSLSVLCHALYVSPSVFTTDKSVVDNFKLGGVASRIAMRIQLVHKFEDVISLDNLLSAWTEFLNGKRKKRDVQVFSRNLIDNLVELHDDLKNYKYRHGPYRAFSISDPKPRKIHKASVRDRVLHHAIYRALYPFFDRTFIADSYSCREDKGTHMALAQFTTYARQVSRNNTHTCWILKCDIKKFFASIDQNILLGILQAYIPDKNILWLSQEVISSFCSTETGKGLPLGNLTSQLFVNIYMNEFDQYVQHYLKPERYIRYADDFVFLSEDKAYLEGLIPIISTTLQNLLALSLHPDKVYIQSLASGLDFLGWIHFTDHRVLRPATVKRMRKRIIEHPTPETLQSYLGLLRHGNTERLEQTVVNDYLLHEKI